MQRFFFFLFCGFEFKSDMWWRCLFFFFSHGTHWQNVGADSKFKEEAAGGPETKGERKAESDRVRSAEERRRSSEKEEGFKSVPPPSESAAAAAGMGVPAQRKQRSSSDSDASHHKRASVMNKVKGEMKVLLGMASRNKDKVEEGEKLKQGSD
jgi:hypothetical protein